MEIRAFAPLYGPSAAGRATGTAGSLLPSTSVTASTTAATSAAFSGSPSGGRYQLQISNNTTGWAYVNFGNLGLGVTAATVAASYPVATGSVVIISVDPEVNAASVILGSGTGTVIFTRGEGL